MKHIKLFEYFKPMKNFLYHTAKIYDSNFILHDDKLKESSTWGGISFSRDKNYWYEGRIRPIRYVFDKDLLKHNHKIETYDDENTFSSDFYSKSNPKRTFPVESEEKISKKINNLHLYLTEIQISKDIYSEKYNNSIRKEFFEILDNYVKKYPHIKINYYNIEPYLTTIKKPKMRNHFKVKKDNENFKYI